ncbi:MAG TPA: ABC transporter ATP-binding protein [Rectinemataceae bacterium]|nr:ABC transporter ATP-binding protein [Rectinemataceae bacterium]
MNAILNVAGLEKSYGGIKAIDGIDISVERGEIFGLLGHNGAGKTTTIECILGTKKADAGSVRILGLDPILNRRQLFARVTVQFQDSAYQDKLKVNEACEVAAALYPHRGDWTLLLDSFGLKDKGKTLISELSGGERQKLSVLLALIPEPEILFLDELTTGLDPKARRDIWDCLDALRKSGVTIILTSHYMDEVERLCDRILILKKGKVVARGRPAELVAEQGLKNLEEVFLLYLADDEAEGGEVAV